ncbi:stage II sporulation protein M [Bhargavaea ullalensis]|uniref:Membrane protein SpoIIM required for sporulation n=1 Tax=Bhargavaea ullalensis TaxID=1265685 RepID=A0ABV2G8B2_9BACL
MPLEKSVIKRSINFLFLSITISVVMMVITYVINPNINEVTAGIGSGVSKQISESSGMGKVWAFIFNNGFIVPLQMFVLALIPIPFLFLLNLISTVALPGILFGVALHIEEGYGLIFATLPHYLFEVFAYCLFAAVLYSLNQNMRMQIKTIFKREKTEVPLFESILDTAKSFVVLVLPLIIVAAFLETYIADLIFDLF